MSNKNNATANAVEKTDGIPDLSNALSDMEKKAAAEKAKLEAERSEKLKEAEAKMPAGAKAFILPKTGKICVVHEGKGRHSIEAHRIIDGDSTLYLPALMSLLTTIDGRDMVLEDLTDMNLPDYHAIQSNFSDSNFTSPQGT